MTYITWDKRKNALTWKQHREKFSNMLMQDSEYSHIINTIKQWDCLSTALADTLHNQHLNAVPLKQWDALGVQCWGPYSFTDRDGRERRCSKRGPSTLAYRVCVLKEAVRLMQEDPNTDNLCPVKPLLPYELCP